MKTISVINLLNSMKEFYKRHFFVITVLVFSVFTLTIPNDLNAQNKQSKFQKNISNYCRVYGEVKDYNGALLPESFVKFKSNSFEQTVKTNFKGEYSMKLSHNIYEVATQLRSGLDTYKRANLNVSCKNEILINLYSFLDLRSDEDEISKFNFYSFSNTRIKNRKLNFVIAYLNKQTIDNDLIYENTTLTHDKYTIFANKIVKDFKNRTLLAEGDIWLEDGNKRTRYRKLIMKFSKAGIKIIGQAEFPPKGKKES